jgi:hypothetical protein
VRVFTAGPIIKLCAGGCVFITGGGAVKEKKRETAPAI